ncbi:MAG: glycosyltransferase family 2 protein [Kiritimatiellia bacterium]
MNLSVIILTYNEQLHLQRCIENVKELADEIFVVDCFSTDGTQDIARRLGATVVEHAWPGLYAPQFNWALDHLPITTEWILRLDADEYLMPELIDEIKEKLNDLPKDVSGVEIPLLRVFCGRKILHGMGKIKLLRLFRRGKGRCEEKLMDEHMDVLSGKTRSFHGAFADHNLNDLSWWTRKHDTYALREAVDLLFVFDGTSKKKRYRNMPLLWRAMAYFVYRYFVRFGFLDGREGFLWHFLQGWWYRTLVDAKVMEIEKAYEQTDKKQSLVDFVKDYLVARGINMTFSKRS